jgi:steroid delta-isomerase-like uncharacterized protein
MQKAGGQCTVRLQIVGRIIMRRRVLVVGLLLATFVFGCGQSTKEQLEANKNLVQEFAARVEAKDWDALDALVAEDLQRHSRASTQSPEIRSREEFIRFEQVVNEAFPDRHVAYEIMVAEGDMVAAYATFTGTNSEPFGGVPATNKMLEVKYLAMFRVDKGKIAEVWVEWDNLSRLNQLGLSPLTVVEKRNKELVHRMNEEVWNQGNLEVLDELFSKDFVRHFLPNGSVTRGLDQFRDHISSHREAFPDWAEDIKLMVAEGNLVATQFTSTGTNEGSFLGNSPTGNRIHISEMSIYRIVDGKIVEQWLIPDLLSLNQQLGLGSQSKYD